MSTLTKYSNLEMLNYPDCPALLENGKCAYTGTDCVGTSCYGLATGERQKNSCLHVQKRLSMLDEATQRRISQKYYGGQRPWKKGKN
jgi:hypothetical protein